jgi:hypothetical protein
LVLEVAKLALNRLFRAMLPNILGLVGQASLE